MPPPATDDDARLDRAAALIAGARLDRRPLEPLPDDGRPRDEAEGYAVQDRVHARLAAAGRGAVAGYKIGCTTPVMQERLGIDTPCGGGVLDDAVHRERAELACADFVKAGVECEIAVRLGAELAPAAAPFDADSVARAVDACMAAIELVDNRYADFRALGTATLIADDFFGAGCVLGPPVADWRRLDLAAAAGRTLVDGTEIGRGRGADVMGHPFHALAWLANACATRGRALRAGEVVLTGSMVAAHYPAPGERVTVAVEGLGEATARFA